MRHKRETSSSRSVLYLLEESFWLKGMQSKGLKRLLLPMSSGRKIDQSRNFFPSFFSSACCSAVDDERRNWRAFVLFYHHFFIKYVSSFGPHAGGACEADAVINIHTWPLIECMVVGTHIPRVCPQLPLCFLVCAQSTWNAKLSLS